MFNPFIGRDQTWLEARLAELQEQFAAGKVLVEAGAGDAHARELVGMSVSQAIEQVMLALRVLAPDKYPASQVFRVRRTSPRYIWGS